MAGLVLSQHPTTAKQNQHTWSQPQITHWLHNSVFPTFASQNTKAYMSKTIFSLRYYKGHNLEAKVLKHHTALVFLACRHELVSRQPLHSTPSCSAEVHGATSHSNV
ncbi:hypothetical protein L596_003442 [Steinernema carpocapsae]|uniref:Uncharacterized protein n=1 Tax=Steinernema carpocapsae TaxID=34508 RepID=A0A4U8USM4_STECR|nr:hypothetical protein L596_003442 [Steinernema carpocapsae]